MIRKRRSDFLIVDKKSYCVIWIVICLFAIGCSTIKEQGDIPRPPAFAESDHMIVIKGEINYHDQIVYDKEVTIYPEAYISTSGSGKIIFSKKINIIGGTQVFDNQAQIEFSRDCIGTLNVGWFGAKGYDGEDDTKAFQKTLAIAGALSNTVNVYVPIGRYMITEQLVVDNASPLNKSINLIGEGMSSSTNDGASLIWNGSPGASMLLVKNNYLSKIESLDFAAETYKEVKYNIELKPKVYQLAFRDCSFSGAKGEGSANINLNEGDSGQVSEISFNNCVFHALTLNNRTWLTGSAVKGGKANTKNFYFDRCSFLGYVDAAINIEISETINVSNSTFSHNGTDIICLLGSLVATSNYSEGSGSFFKSTESNNLAFTTLINNFFDGNPTEDYVITKGAGSLVMINNNFGGSGGLDSINLIRWDSHIISSIFSVGNFFRNGSSTASPVVFSGRNTVSPDIFKSEMDKIGYDGPSARKIKN